MRIRHLPTGLIVVATESRSQHRNKEAALAELERRLLKRMERRKPRTKTRPTKASAERRIESKKRRGDILKQRKADD